MAPTRCENPGSIPKLGPDPTLLGRKEIDALYETLDAVLRALKELKVEAIVTGGSLLGAIRQHSILFCDDDVDLTIIDNTGEVYESLVKPKLQQALGKSYLYQIRPWEGGDRIRPKRMSNVFLDLFVLRKFESMDDFRSLVGVKKNGQPQSDNYVNGIVDKMVACTSCDDDRTPLCPFWHFNTRKAVEMWTKEVYREKELFPLDRNLKMGPVIGVCGPRMPVKLLKRAFGEDCFDVYFQSISHRTESKSLHHKHEAAVSTDLPPLVSAGGTWESGVKQPLEDHHYLPMQPISRAARRPTMHCKQRLLEYLEKQSHLEYQWTRSEIYAVKPTFCEAENYERTVYMDGVFDLFHIGHLEAIRQCKLLGKRVIIGVTGDLDATGYKRAPVVPETERVAIIKSLKEVDDVVCPCPLIVTEAFMEEHKIDLVVHGFANEADADRQEEFFKVPAAMGKFQRISYYDGLSTTDRIRIIQSQINHEYSTCSNDKNVEPNKKQWFGESLVVATNGASEIPFDPFPIELRQVIEPHIRKATKRREEALRAIRQATGKAAYDSALSRFEECLGRESSLCFDASRSLLRDSFLKCLNLSDDFDLSRIHEYTVCKDELMHRLTRQHSDFQETYDEFVRNVCAPHLASLYPCDEIYYQAFPCLRIVQPNEFSIGPHCDVAYGHHPCSINFYLPFTKIGGASSLFLESRTAAEDWHPIIGNYGHIKLFAGAIRLHWTVENKTDYTRVSLDFRLIPGPLFSDIKCGGSLPGGQKDVYRSSSGYYSRCRRHVLADGKEVVWKRDGELQQPDARIGFPWTVKDWGKYWQKQKQR